MKTYKNAGWKQILAIALTAVALTACGKKSDSSGTPPPGTVSPPVGGGPGTGGLPGGCVPITSQIPFTGQGIYVDSANIIGGQIPSMDPAAYQAQGQFGLGGGGAGPYARQGVDGSLQMNIQSTNSGQQWQQYGLGYPPGPAYVTGVLQISQATIQDIAYQVAIGRIPLPNMQGQYGQINPAQICVSAMGMNMGHYGHYLHSGKVYLYLNGTQYGYALVF